MKNTKWTSTSSWQAKRIKYVYMCSPLFLRNNISKFSVLKRRLSSDVSGNSWINWRNSMTFFDLDTQNNRIPDIDEGYRRDPFGIPDGDCKCKTH